MLDEGAAIVLEMLELDKIELEVPKIEIIEEEVGTLDICMLELEGLDADALGSSTAVVLIAPGTTSVLGVEVAAAVFPL